MLAKDLIKILKRNKKGTVFVLINGIYCPIEDITFSITSDEGNYVIIEPKDITQIS